jgi:hypothetical protein
VCGGWQPGALRLMVRVLIGLPPIEKPWSIR